MILYVIAGRDRCKIGITSCIESRLRAHRCMCPEAELQLVIEYPDRGKARTAERKALDLARGMPGVTVRQEVVQGCSPALLAQAVAEELVE